MAYLVNSFSSPSLNLQLRKDVPFSSKTTFLTGHLPHLLLKSVNWDKKHSQNIGYKLLKCRFAKVKEASSSDPYTLIKEPHKYFDQVFITVRSGDGGHGAVLSMPTQKVSSKTQGRNVQEKKKKSLFKRGGDGSLILPIGGHGGDVIIYADEGKDSLLEFHKKKRYNAKRGGNVDAMGVLTSLMHDGFPGPMMRIPVPVGTVVKRKKGTVIKDLAKPGDEVLVARGGQGGISLVEMPEHKRKKLMALTSNVMRDENDKISLVEMPEHKRKKLMALTSNVMRDENDKVFVLGQPGEEVSLELILRVVADVGLVGLPNAGKSTLLASITLARPDIANYPFTTLMPNLGRLDGDPSLGAGEYSSEATLADLPGLIEGAHLGKGLGRNFLRHLRRTRLLVHVVDAAAEDPVKDYRTVKEELRMYNPEYLERPYVVVLNKIDLPEARDRLPSLIEEISMIGYNEVPSKPARAFHEVNQPLPLLTEGASTTSALLEPLIKDKKDRQIEEYPRPLSVVGVSVLKGINIDEMLMGIRTALRKCHEGSDKLMVSGTSYT
ncbi:Gtpase obg [Thalictrum thalictroides]|uniref:Gtpase obg n=1 Tax=Thalictrum thalictroides TaxID=46969 RepID=A0A7J6VBF7_THATH|nr:Gtpase obg [Thalictrum thalictroides]